MTRPCPGIGGVVPIIPRALPAVEAENARLVALVRQRRMSPLVANPPAPDRPAVEPMHHVGELCQRSGKLRYASPEAAEKRRKTIKRVRGENLSAFRCHFCHGWHLGHNDINRAKSSTDRRLRRGHRG